MLDTSVQAKIVRLLLQIKEKNKLAYIFISHDLEMLSLIADKFVYLWFKEERCFLIVIF